MGTFSGGFMVDPATGRPVAGATVRVSEYGTDAPVTPTTGPVATGVHGGYQPFHVEGVDAVTLRAGDVEQVVVSIEKQLESHSGTSGSGVLIVRTTSLATIPAGSTEGELTGYRNSAPSAITIAGETLESGDWGVWGWFGGAWVLLNKSGSSGGVIVPDEEPPTAPTNLQATPGANSVALTWTAATDNVGIGGYEARVQQSGMTTWTTWAPLASGGSLTGLTPTTGYTAQVRALDLAGNPGPSASATFTTTAVPLTGDVTDTFTAADGTALIGRTTTTGGKTWEADSIGLIPGTNTGLTIRDNKITNTVANSRARIPVNPGPIEASLDYATNQIVRLAAGGATNSLVSITISGATLSLSVNGASQGSYPTTPAQGRVTLTWDGTNASASINGTVVVGPVPATLPTTGYVAVAIANTTPVELHTQWLDNLAVTYL